MISRTAPAAAASAVPGPPPGGGRPSPWQRSLAAAVTDVGELLELVGLGPGALGATGAAGAAAAARDFRLRVPRGFVARMRRGDPADPLLRQVLAVGEETRAVAGFSADPLAESDASPAPGLLRKYRGRALLVVTGACAVHCRYCFRRHYPYAERHPRDGWAAALDLLAGDPGIDEVILSGGDPLTLPDPLLAELARDLAAIPHLTRLRVHTRLPVVLPERVDAALLDWLAPVAGGRLAPVVVIHANHAREIDAAVVAALGRLRRAGVTLLNQAVLLRGVNDDAGALCQLSEAVFAAGALPYYLHLLDPVAGAAHFAVGEDEARRLLSTVIARLPGYLVPRLVRERPGAPAKVPIAVPIEVPVDLRTEATAAARGAARR